MATMPNDVHSLTLDLIRQAKSIRITTRSGSVYRASRTPSRSWDVLRYGTGGERSVMLGVMIRINLQEGGLQVGPWTTTGLSEVEILD